MLRSQRRQFCHLLCGKQISLRPNSECVLANLRPPVCVPVGDGPTEALLLTQLANQLANHVTRRQRGRNTSQVLNSHLNPRILPALLNESARTSAGTTRHTCGGLSPPLAVHHRPAVKPDPDATPWSPFVLSVVSPDTRTAVAMTQQDDKTETSRRRGSFQSRTGSETGSVSLLAFV